MKREEQPYRLDEQELRGLAALAETARILKDPEPIWAGWDFDTIPLALTSRERQGYFLVQAGSCLPAGAEEVAAGVHFVPDGHFPPDNRAVVLPLEGCATGWIPIRWVGNSSTELQEFMLRAARLSFLAGLRTGDGHSAWKNAALVESVEQHEDTLPDPENVAACHALARVEADLLADCQKETSPRELARMTKAFCLVRRERHVYYDEAEIADEHEAELSDGLGLYLEFLILRRAAAQTQGCHPVLTAASGLTRWNDARPLMRARLRGLRSSALASDYGMRKRLPYFGMGEALLLDRLGMEWRQKVTELPLDRILEEAVTYDGSAQDDALLQSILRTYDFLKKLEEESARLRVLRQRKKRVEQEIWRASGTLLTVDVSAISLWKEKMNGYQEAIVGDSLRMYEGGVLFLSGETRLEFHDVLVLEDIKNLLLQVRTPLHSFVLETERGSHQSTRRAAFSEGLTIEIPGICIRAQEGYVQSMEGGLFIKIER